MLLAEQILRAIHTRMGSAVRVTGAWPFVAPDEAEYPFATYSVVAEWQDRTFNTDMSIVTVQFSVFDDDPSPSDTVGALCEIEQLFDRQPLSLPVTDDGVKCVCCLKSTNGVRYLDQDHYWNGTADYEIRVQKNKNANLESSSSSSSSSHSST